MYALSQFQVPSSSAQHIVIGVSKDPCFCCESWYELLNNNLKGVMFRLQPGHCKVYPGWQRSGIAEGDSYVIRKFWDRVDRMIEAVVHAEHWDFVPSLMSAPIKAEFLDSSFQILKNISVDV
jgi:OTT_1508-like deaminase